jgi:hypothetical protein
VLQTVIDDAATHSVAALHDRYLDAVQDAVEAAGADAAANTTAVERERVQALCAGEPVELTVAEAASLLALDESVSGETIAAETRDHLLLRMTTGVIDVDTIAANVDIDMRATEIQQGLEGRTPLSLDRLAAIHRFIEERNR